MDRPGKSELALSLLRLLPVGDGDDGGSKCRQAPPELQAHCEGRNGEPEGRLPVKAARSGGGVRTGTWMRPLQQRQMLAWRGSREVSSTYYCKCTPWTT